MKIKLINSILTLCIIAAASAVLAKSQPNIIFILSDDQDWTETAVQMHPDYANSRSRYIETPNLQKLAKQGMTFSDAYSPAPVCSPTRISLQLGKNPATLHWTKASPVMTAESNYPLLPPNFSRSIAAESVTIAEMLKSAGYATAHYGKWHLSGGGPEKHGYDESDGDTSNGDAAPHVPPNPVDIFGITNRANAFMDTNTRSGTPFFMQLSHHALHYPENSATELKEKYARLSGGSVEDKNVQRMAMAEHLDTGLGLIMEHIDQLGIADNTYLIFMSDNGGGGGGGGGGRNADSTERRENVRPLTAGKGGVWEGGIRVPLVIRGPGVKAGVYCRSRVVGYDFYPTFCKLAGVTQAMPEGLEGGDLSHLFSEGSGSVMRPRKELVFHFPHYQGDTPHSAILLDNYKLMKWYEDGRIRLTDLEKDIGETNDLSKQMPERASDMEALLDKYLREVNAQLPVSNPQYDPSKPSVERRGGNGDENTRNRQRGERSERGQGGGQRGQNQRRSDRTQ